MFKHFSMTQQFSVLRIEVLHYGFNVPIGRHRGLELCVEATGCHRLFMQLVYVFGLAPA